MGPLVMCRITGRRVTFEYTLLSGVNDSPQCAEQLAALLRRHDSMRSHVNVSSVLGASGGWCWLGDSDVE